MPGPYTPGRTFVDAYQKGFQVASEARALFEDREAKRRAEVTSAQVQKQLQELQSPVAAVQAELDAMNEKMAAGEFVSPQEYRSAQARAALKGFDAITKQMNVLNAAILGDPTNSHLKNVLTPIMEERSSVFEKAMGVLQQGEVMAEKQRSQESEQTHEGEMLQTEMWWRRLLQDERFGFEKEKQAREHGHETREREATQEFEEFQNQQDRALEYYKTDIRAEVEREGLSLEERRVKLAEDEWFSLSAERQFREFLTGMEVVQTAKAAGLRDEEIARHTGLSVEAVQGLQDQYVGMTEAIAAELKRAEQHLADLQQDPTATKQQLDRARANVKFIRGQHQEAYDAELRSRQRKLEHGAILGTLYSWGAHARKYGENIAGAPTYLWKAPREFGKGVMDAEEADSPRERAWERAK